MLVYICDDEEQDRMRLSRSLKKYVDALESEYMLVNVEIDTFETADEMLAAYWSKRQKPDLIFLDIYMQRKDGMEAAKALRESGCRAGIIFVTSSDDHAIESYDVDALYYLKKPYTKEKFQAAMEKCRDVFLRSGASFNVSVNREKYSIPYREILYFETSGHNVTLYSRSQSPISVRMSMKEIEENVGEYAAFVPVGKSYIVNLNYVERIHDGVLYLSNRSQIPIPVRKVKEVQSAYAAFKADGSRQGPASFTVRKGN